MKPINAAADEKKKSDPLELTAQIAQFTKCRAKAVYWDHSNESIAASGTELHHQEALAQHIVKESRFADVLIMDADALVDNDNTTRIPFITKFVLTNSECPVIVAATVFNNIEEIIFAYDGSASAVYAIKQFTALFPSLTDRRLTVLQINRHEGQAVNDRHDILELLQRYYSTVGFRCLVGEAGDTLLKYLGDKKNAIVVIGAFGSKNFILPYRQSTAEPLINNKIGLPIFTAHRS